MNPAPLPPPRPARPGKRPTKQEAVLAVLRAGPATSQPPHPSALLLQLPDVSSGLLVPMPATPDFTPAGGPWLSHGWLPGPILRAQRRLRTRLAHNLC